jgi:hypothetical protein
MCGAPWIVCSTPPKKVRGEKRSLPNNPAIGNPAGSVP